MSNKTINLSKSLELKEIFEIIKSKSGTYNPQLKSNYISLKNHGINCFLKKDSSRTVIVALQLPLGYQIMAVTPGILASRLLGNNAGIVAEFGISFIFIVIFLFIIQSFYFSSKSKKLENLCLDLESLLEGETNLNSL